MRTAKEIAERINASGERYFGERARGWEGNGVSRIYFGSDFVTIEQDGSMHADKPGKSRAQTAGQSAIDLVETAMS